MKQTTLKKLASVENSIFMFQQQSLHEWAKSNEVNSQHVYCEPHASSLLLFSNTTQLVKLVTAKRWWHMSYTKKHSLTKFCLCLLCRLIVFSFFVFVLFVFPFIFYSFNIFKSNVFDCLLRLAWFCLDWICGKKNKFKFLKCHDEHNKTLLRRLSNW